MINWINDGKDSYHFYGKKKYYTKQCYDDGSILIIKYPSYEYYENYNLGDNLGKRIKEYWINF